MSGRTGFRIVTIAVLAMSVSMAGSATALTSTTTTIIRTGRDQPTVMSVVGYVSPSPTNTPRPVVRLFKKRSDGTWALLDKKAGTWGEPSGEGRPFTANMSPVPTSGVCKVVAKYAGNDTFGKSRAKTVVSCKTGYPVS